MFATLLLTLAFSAPVPKDGPVAPPKAPPPAMEFVKFDGKTAVRMASITEVVSVPKTSEHTIVVNGVPKATTRVTYVSGLQTKLESVTANWDLKATTFVTAGGTKLTAQEAGERLKNGDICLVLASDQTIEPVYRKALKADIIIITYPTPKPAVAPKK